MYYIVAVHGIHGSMCYNPELGMVEAGGTLEPCLSSIFPSGSTSDLHAYLCMCVYIHILHTLTHTILKLKTSVQSQFRQEKTQ